MSGCVQTPAQANRIEALKVTTAAEQLPSHDHLYNAWAEGRLSGYRSGYVDGVRWGIFCGISTAACAALLLFSTVSALGWF